MPKMLLASSPVEIEAKAEEAGFSREAHDVALHMFHTLTDQLGQAAIALHVPHESWPNHRFYFGRIGGEIGTLLGELLARPDMLDVTTELQHRPDTPSGLFVQAVQGEFHDILVGREDHDGSRPLQDASRSVR